MWWRSCTALICLLFDVTLTTFYIQEFFLYQFCASTHSAYQNYSAKIRHIAHEEMKYIYGKVEYAAMSILVDAC